MSGAWIAAYVALAAAVGLTLLVVLGTLRRTNALLEEAEARLAGAPGDAAIDFGGAPAGTVVPPFTVTDRVGETVSSAQLFRRDSLVLFLGAHCPPCADLVRTLDDVDAELDGVPLYVVHENEAELDYELPPRTTVLRQTQRAASDAFANKATPQAFAVARGGVVVDSLIPGSRRHLRRLAEQLTRGGDAAAPLTAVRSID